MNDARGECGGHGSRACLRMGGEDGRTCFLGGVRHEKEEWLPSVFLQSSQPFMGAAAAAAAVARRRPACLVDMHTDVLEYMSLHLLLPVSFATPI